MWNPWPTSSARSSCTIDLASRAENTRSTPAEEAGAARYCLTIFASAGHTISFFSVLEQIDTQVALLFLSEVQLELILLLLRHSTLLALSFFTRAPSKPAS